MSAKTYELIIPEEPPIGTIVRTRVARLKYERVNELWFPTLGGAGVTWVALLRRGPLTDVTPLRTFAMPEEPPIGTKVEDRDGDVWTRRDNGFWSIDRGVTVGCKWCDVMNFGPLTEVR